MENIEQTLHQTKKNYNALQLNMDLLSNMYKDSLKNLEAMKCSMNDVTRERDSMGKKMSILVKKLQIEKQENIRKDKLIKKILAAKHAGTAALNDSIEELNEATEKAEVSDAAIEVSPILHIHTIQSHDVKLIINCNLNSNFACVSPPSMHTFLELTLMLVLKTKILDQEVARCHTEIKKLEISNEELKKQLEETSQKLLPLEAQAHDYKLKWTRANAEKNALETLQKDRISSMEDSLSMTEDEKKELKSLRQAMRESKRTCAQLEKLLQKAEKRIVSLENEKKKLLKKRVT